MATKFTVIFRAWDDQSTEADNIRIEHVEITKPGSKDEPELLREAIWLAYEKMWDEHGECWQDRDEMKDMAPVVAVFPGHHQDRYPVVMEEDYATSD